MSNGASNTLNCRHGMTARQRHVRMLAQGWRCPICDEPYGEGDHRPVVDHEHKPGEKPNNRSSKKDRVPRRDVICARCNRMLGAANDNPETLRRGIAYLEWWHAHNRRIEAEERAYDEALRQALAEVEQEEREG